jgi:hypothetical protein
MKVVAKPSFIPSRKPLEDAFDCTPALFVDEGIPADVVAVLSNGGLGGIHKQLLERPGLKWLQHPAASQPWEGRG